MGGGIEKEALCMCVVKVPTLPEVLELEGLGPLMAHFVDADPVMRSIARQVLIELRISEVAATGVDVPTAVNHSCRV